MVEKDLWKLDIEHLNALYNKEASQLQERLLAGATWEQVNEERKRVGELSTIIYKKSNPSHFNNPAENLSRKDP